MRDEAQAIIIGGGVAGCSIAYHLTKMGWRDIVLLERGQLTGGSTHRAAGLIGQLRGTYNLTRMIMYSVELYGRLREETGLDPDWRQVGSLRLASSTLRMEEIRRLAAQAKAFGLEVELLTPQDAVALCPVISDRDLVGGAYIPTDGRIDPSGLAYALAHAARAGGCEIHTQTNVTGIDVRNGRVHAVRTTQGTVRAPVIVSAAGVWSWHLGKMIGVTIPIVPIQHQYMVTVPFDVPRDLPTLRDQDLRIYAREEVGGLIVGGYEGNPIPCGPPPIPPELDAARMTANWDHFEPLARNAAVRIPGLEQAGIRRLMVGPEVFTPDGDFLLGESADVQGFFIAGGTPGIAAAGGVGKAMAEWIVEGRPTLDLWRADVRRFGDQYADRGVTVARATEVYARNYTVHLPLEEFESARPLRTSAPYPRLVALGAVLGEKAGWERPNWFATNEGEHPAGPVPEGWIRHNWSPAISAEHTATRAGAGIFDFSSFSKFEVDGPGALASLQWITDNDLDKPAGTVTYTQMLNRRGGIECDLTITRLAADRFFIVTGSAFGVHDFAWI
ncbi:MAG TPA: FAD-dependent oxidoreductase, partial [bacterium]